MLKPAEMSKVIITGPKSVQESIIKEMHSLKILHIVEHSKNEMADIGTPLESANRLSELLVKARALISALGIKKNDSSYNLKGIVEIESNLKKLNEDVRINLDELKKAEESMAKNESLRLELEILENIDANLEIFTSYKSLHYSTGFLKNNNSTEKIKKEISKITENFMLLSSESKKGLFISLFVDVKYKDSAASILQKENFSPVNLISIIGMKGTASANLKKISEQAANLQKKKEKIKEQLSRLSKENSEFLLASENFLVEQLEKAEAPLKFASTPSSFLVKGWVPTENLHASIDKLNKAGKNKIFIHFEPAKKEDKVPVKLKNPKLAKSFEFFIDLYGFPTYREIDPTFFVFLTFPIFFGIMLGDIGYGLVSLLFFWILKSKMPKARNFFNILLLASFVSIIFGFFYGEFFGEEKILGFAFPHLISRVEQMFTLLYIAIGIGVVHVNIGLVIGFINELKSHGLKMALYGKASWILLQIGVALLVLSYVNKITISPLIGAVFMALSILMLYKGEGIKGIIELPSILTNIMSYARLMAIGLSSVELALVINESAKEFFHKGGFFILIGILILIIGHLINIMLGLLGSFLHSLRLHYVEFFSKFFHGGAKKYQPFGAKE